MGLLQIDVVADTMKHPGPGGERGDSAIEFAWRVHGALDSWTGKVDSKASIVLAIESAVVGFVVSLSKRGERFGSLHAANLTWYRVGLGLVLASALLSVLVVVPQLNRRGARREWAANMIYFGHLRRWNPSDLANALGRAQPEEEQLARQLVAMSRIAWRKHSWLQYSIGCLIVGAACLVIAGTA